MATENPHVRRPREKHPPGWEPHVEERGDGTATAVSRPLETANPDHDELIRGWLLDPEVWEIVGHVNCRRWQRYDHEWLYYYKADLRRRDVAVHEDIDLLCKKVLRRGPIRRRAELVTTGNALVVNWADWQVGKEDGDGVEGTTQRLSDMIGKVEDRADALRRSGVNIAGLYVNGLGDLGEGCGGHYAQQGFRTKLNVREQRKLIRWAIDSALESWAKKFAWIGVKAVGGNHGEEREAGKSYTDFADNRDVAVFEDVAFAYSKNLDRYGHVSFALPNDDLTITYEHEGIVIGLAHGHQAGYTRGGDPAAKIANWWAGQSVGRQPIGDADILITGHYHHPWVRTLGTRVHFGCPALDGGSDWWRNTAGLDSPPGTLTFVVNAAGWSNFEIL